MSIRTNPSRAHRAAVTVAGVALAGGALFGLAACDAGAQTPYPERTSESPTPTPSESIFPTPVPTTVDDSGTLGG